jgi:geranylgeranyl transferase type-1 subunit beta
MTSREPDEISLNIPRQVKYWLRCLKTFLPNPYTSADASRLLLAFFSVSALDLLGVLHTTTTPEERAGWIDWVYSCQIPSGGFRGSPALALSSTNTEGSKIWDPANVAATYFSLAILIMLRDDLKRVKRKECLEAIAKLQRDDGSFGETFVDGNIEGGRDPRFGYVATGIRWFLRGKGGQLEKDVLDWDIEKLVSYIRSSEVRPNFKDLKAKKFGLTIP